jgi:hypothetical protein
MNTDEARIRDLEDQLRALQTFREADKHTIAQLKAELGEAHQLIDELRDNAQDYRDTMEAWKQSFYMELVDKRTWREASGIWEQHDALIDKWNDLVTKWNRAVPEFNAAILRRNVGRPIAASEAQIARVRKLHKGGMSLRNIATETNLGMQTVRTIIAKSSGNDRATMNRMERIDPDHAKVKEWRGRKRTRQALPKKIDKVIDDADELIKRAKGLG